MRLQHHNIKSVDDLKPYLNDDRLDKAIASLIGDFDPPAIEKWKEENASDLKRISYPPLEDMADALAKMYSNDVELQTEGQNQLYAYSRKCIDVKKKFKGRVEK